MRIVSYPVLGVFGVLLIYSISVGRSELLGYSGSGVEFMICHKYVATCETVIVCRRARLAGDLQTDW